MNDPAPQAATWPDFIIIGAMKCATTTLHAQLTRQPGIFVHGLGEVEFFSDDRRYARGMQWYASLFDQAGPDCLRGERSTGYTKLPTFPHTVSRMHRHLPRVKLIHVMRHPVDRLLSHYAHEWVLGRVSDPIELALERHPEFVAYGRYEMQLRPYLETFGPAQVLPMFFERLVAHPQEELERLCRFLEYRGMPRWVEELGPQNVSRERVRRGAIRDRILGGSVLTRIRRRWIPEAVRNRIKRLWQMRELPRIPPAKLEALHRGFDDDLERLGARLGTPLSCRNFKEAVASRPLEWTR